MSPDRYRQIIRLFPEIEQLEAIYFPLYDTQPFTGQNCLQFFDVPVGACGKTIADTNMFCAGILPAPQYFDLQAFQIVYRGSAPRQFTDAHSYVELIIGAKIYVQRSPLGVFTGPGGSAVAHVLLPPNQLFQARIVFPGQPPRSRGAVTLAMIGTLFRPYQ